MPLKTTVILWVVYLLGQAVHVLMKANLTIKSKLNGTNTYMEFLKTNGVLIGTRFFLCTMIFLLWWDSPEFIETIIKRFAPSTNLTFPLNYATSGIYGYCSDSILDKAIGIAGLQKEVPPMATPPVPPASTVS